MVELFRTGRLLRAFDYKNKKEKEKRKRKEEKKKPIFLFLNCKRQESEEIHVGYE